MTAALLIAALACARPATTPPGGAWRSPEDPRMPRFQFADLPGWLGYAVAVRTERQLPWTPHHPHATVVLLDPDAAWGELDEGAAFRGTSIEGELGLRYSELSSVPAGCDDIPTPMVALTGPHDPGEILVWVTPEGGGEAVRVVDGPVSPDRRTWTAGALEIEVERTGEHAGRIVVRDGGKKAYAARWEKEPIDAVQLTPADLTAPYDTAVPVPAAAFVLPGGERVLVLRTLGYEGVTFEVLRDAGREWVPAGRQYIYMCAV